MDGAKRLRDNHGTDPTLSGGDIDARWEDAESGADDRWELDPASSEDYAERTKDQE
jgi:hypothetical protein